MSSSILKDKSYQFAIRIVRLYQYLSQEKKEFVLSKQILRSGTSVGACISEAMYAQTKKDFTHKLSIALKEAHETEYWMNLLKDTDHLDQIMFASLNSDLKEVLKMLIASIKTSKKNAE